MAYCTGSHTKFYHRYHIVWVTKVLQGRFVKVLQKGGDHAVVRIGVKRIKGRSSRKIQMEFPDLKKRFWGRRFWADISRPHQEM